MAFTQKSVQRNKDKAVALTIQEDHWEKINEDKKKVAGLCIQGTRVENFQYKRLFCQRWYVI